MLATHAMGRAMTGSGAASILEIVRWTVAESVIEADSERMNSVEARMAALNTEKAGLEARLAAAEALVREWQPQALVVGVPFHPDGASHENTARARKFARQLRSRFPKLPVYEVDERYSTTEALSQGAADADAGAACVILEQFLRSMG